MIFFDIDGTLLDHDRAVRAAATAFQQQHAEAFPEPPEDFISRWRAVGKKHDDRFVAGEISFQQQRRARLREIFAAKRPLADAEADALFAEYLAHYEANWRLYPDAVDCLKDLLPEGIGVISNGGSAQQRRKIEVLGIGSLFAVVVISDDLGVAKPEPGIFAFACREAGRPPSECFYVGDRLQTDAEASSRAGLVGIWLNRKGENADTRVPVISTLKDLAKVVSG